MCSSLPTWLSMLCSLAGQRAPQGSGVCPQPADCSDTHWTGSPKRLGQTSISPLPRCHLLPAVKEKCWADTKMQGQAECPRASRPPHQRQELPPAWSGSRARRACSQEPGNGQQQLSLRAEAGSTSWPCIASTPQPSAARAQCSQRSRGRAGPRLPAAGAKEPSWEAAGHSAPVQPGELPQPRAEQGSRYLRSCPLLSWAMFSLLL